METERKMILQMLQEGKVTIDEAEKLLSKLQDQQKSKTDQASKPAKSINRKFLRVVVTEQDSTKVNINVPIALAEVALKLVPKDKLKIKNQDINIDEILQLIDDEAEGELVNINAVDNGKPVKVKIFVDYKDAG